MFQSAKSPVGFSSLRPRLLPRRSSYPSNFLQLSCRIAFCCSLCYAQLLTHDLSTEKWVITNRNQSITADIEVPGYVLEALQSQHIIPDPLYRYGEQELRWVALDTWTFATSFRLDKEIIGQSNVDLLLSGIDTVADITLNSQLVASLHNLHRQYRLPAKHALVPGNNTLLIRINSSILYEQAAKDTHPYKLPTATAPYALGTWPFLRKTASDGGWDWGPAFAPQGIAGMVVLHAYSSPYLAGVHVQQVHHHQNSTSSLVLEVQVAVPAVVGGHTPGITHSITLTASLPELNKEQQWGVDLMADAKENIVFQTYTMELSHDELELWWPWQLGQPKLYDLHISLTPQTPQCIRGATQKAQELDNEGIKRLAAACSRSLDPCHLQARPASPDFIAVDCKAAQGDNKQTLNCRNGCSTALSRRVGFRDVELVREPLLEGETYYFRVNGVAMFMQGANLIPMAIVPTNVTTGQIEELLDDAKAAHMNMIRVWGGGLYQRQTLYELCDEKGLLVWQEAMFACAAYPRTPEFLEEVSEEIQHQIRRLAWHPSIAIWGGNNEVENSFDWFSATKSNQRLYGVDYQVLFLEVVGKIFGRLDPTRPYVDSSPSNGMLVAREQVKRWGDVWEPQYGDIHFYNYNDDCQDPAIYPKAKFVSEFGFQSFPSFRTLQAVTQEEDWAVDSAMAQFRQRHPDGNPQLQAQLARHFRLPFSWASRASQERNASLYRTWIYLTQVQQAACYQVALGRWRAYSSDSSACTMGVLYWQLNDIWQGPSWSSVNRDGRWKLVHHAVKSVFAPVALHAILSAGALEVYALNSRPVGLVGTLEIWVHRWNESMGSCGKLYHRLVLPTRAAGSELLFRVGREDLQGGLPIDLVEEGFSPYLSFLQFTYEYTLGYSTRRSPQEVAQLPCALSQPGATPFDPTSTADQPFSFSTHLPPRPAFHSKLSLQEKKWTSDTSIRKASTFFFPQPWSAVQLPDPNVTLSNFKQLNETHVSFMASSSFPAPWVLLHGLSWGNFDENGFVLMPCAPREVVFRAAADTNVVVDEFEKGVRAESLFDHQCLD